MPRLGKRLPLAFLQISGEGFELQYESSLPSPGTQINCQIDSVVQRTQVVTQILRYYSIKLERRSSSHPASKMLTEVS